MTKNFFSKKEAIFFGWNNLKKNFRLFLVVMLILGLVSVLPEIGKALIKEKKLFIDIISAVISLFGIILEMGLIKISLKLYDREKPKFSDLFSQYPLFFKMLFGSIFYGLIVILGLILFIIPGIIFAVRFYLFEYLIVDKGSGPVEALKRSFRITQGATGNLFLFLLLVTAINLFGVLAFSIGLLITVPTTALATVFVYRKLLTQSENKTYER